MQTSVRGVLGGITLDTRLSFLSRLEMEMKKSRRPLRSICCLAVSFFFPSFVTIFVIFTSLAARMLLSGYLIIRLVVGFTPLLARFCDTVLMRYVS